MIEYVGAKVFSWDKSSVIPAEVPIYLQHHENAS